MRRKTSRQRARASKFSTSKAFLFSSFFLPFFPRFFSFFCVCDDFFFRFGVKDTFHRLETTITLPILSRLSLPPKMPCPALSLARATATTSRHPCGAANRKMSWRGARSVERNVVRAGGNHEPSSSSSSSGSNNDEEQSPSVDFRPVFALSPPRGQPTLQDAR